MRPQILHEIREMPYSSPYITPRYQKESVTTGYVCAVFIPSNVWSRDTSCMCLQLLRDRLNNKSIV